LDQVQEINLKQRRITICEVANMLGILFWYVPGILAICMCIIVLQNSCPVVVQSPLCLNFWPKNLRNWCSTSFIRAKFSAIRLPLFPELKIALKGRKFNDMAMIAAKLCYAVAKFQTLHFTECFKRWCNYWAHCM
jgi:hypothetical protein